MGAFKRKQPLPPPPSPPLCNEVAVRSMLFAFHACVNGPSSSLAVPLKKKRHVGVRARAPMRQRCAARQLAVRRSAGALAATRQQSYGCACSDVRWGSTSTTFNIITIITTYISHGGCRNVYDASVGLCVFLAHYYGVSPSCCRFVVKQRHRNFPLDSFRVAAQRCGFTLVSKHATALVVS